MPAETVKKTLHDRQYRLVAGAACGFAFNILYALGNGLLGIINGSVWFGVMCAYYIIFSVMRFAALICWRKNSAYTDGSMGRFVIRFSGVLLTVQSLMLTGIIYISLAEHIATEYNEIIMITIASYTFFKIIMAIIRAVKHRKNNQLVYSAIRGIGYADVAVSILTMQRSMLVSFGDMAYNSTLIFNAAAGAAVCIFVFVLGAVMIMKGKKEN